MAQGTETPRRKWQLFDSTLMLRKCLRTVPFKKRQLKKAVIDNNFTEVCAALREGERHQLNKLCTFSTEGCILHVPPLCVAVCHQNLPIVQCLLQHGADPNRLGRISIQRQRPSFSTLAKVSPLMMAMEDHPGEGFPFDPAVASALVEAGADINSTAGSLIREEEEEGGSITYNTPDTLLLKSVDVFLPQSCAVFHFLLDHGADLLIRDTENSFTALQKCLHWLAKCPDEKNLGVYAGELIRRGGFVSASVDQGHSEFRFLMTAAAKAVTNNKDTNAIQCRAHLLLDAGYKCLEMDIARFKTSQLRDIDQCLAERVFGLHVCSLKHLCRLKIRERVVHWHHLDKLTDLPVSLIDYLKLKY